MATSTIIPANPSAVGTTDDSARGGLFVRSNLANPVSGADVTGVRINDSTITIDINGTTQTFTTNQATDSTLSFSIDTTPQTPTASGGVASGTFDINTGTLVLTNTDGSSSSPITGFTFTPRTDAEIDARANQAIADSTTIVKSVNGTSPTDSTGAITISAQVTSAAFESTDSSVLITDDPVDNDVILQSRPVWVGNGGTGGISNNTAVNVARLVLDSSLASTLTLIDDGNGQYRLSAPMTGPITRPASTMTNTIPDESIFDAAGPIAAVFTVDPGTEGGTVSPIQTPSVVRTPTGGTPTTIQTATTNVDTTASTITVTVPAADADEEGDYTISVNPTVNRPDGTQDSIGNTMVTYDRFIPFFTSVGTALTSSATILAATESTRIFVSSDTISVRNGGATPATFYIAIAESQFAVAQDRIFADSGPGIAVLANETFVNGVPARIAVTNAATGVSEMYNVFSGSAQAGQTVALANFRLTRFP